MKKALAVFLVALLVFSLSVCSGLAESKPLEGKFIAYVTPSVGQGGSSFMAQAISNVEKICAEKAEEYGFEYTVVTCAEASAQNNAIDDLLEQGVDMILLWPITGEDVRSGAEATLEAGVQLIIFGRLIYDLGVPLVAGPNVGIGRANAEYFNKFFAEEIAAGKTVNILEFIGDASTSSTERTQGFVEAKDAKINVLQQLNTKWERATAMTQMENILNGMSAEELQSIQAIFTHDEEIALGVLDAIELYTGDVELNIELIGSVGNNDEIRERTKTSEADLGIKTVFCGYPPVGPANVLVSYAIPILMGEKEYADGFNAYFPVVIIDSENIEGYEADALNFLLANG